MQIAVIFNAGADSGKEWWRGEWGRGTVRPKLLLILLDQYALLLINPPYIYLKYCLWMHVKCYATKTEISFKGSNRAVTQYFTLLENSAEN